MCVCLYFQWRPRWRTGNQQQARKLSSPRCLYTQVTSSTTPFPAYTIHSFALPPISPIHSSCYLLCLALQPSLHLPAEANCVYFFT